MNNELCNFTREQDQPGLADGKYLKDTWNENKQH